MQRDYAAEARQLPLRAVMAMEERPSKIPQKEAISFTENDAARALHPHTDPLVIKAVVDNISLHRIFVDNGSSVNILYHDALVKMGLDTSRLAPVTHPLFGFTGDSRIPEGMITLPIIVGEKPSRSTAMITFMVVKRKFAYNAVLGRPTLAALKAVTSVYHLSMKFPTEEGVGTVRDDQFDARTCYSETLRCEKTSP